MSAMPKTRKDDEVMKGILFVLSGPSGTGKGTVCKELLKRGCGVSLSVSMTTRECREGEVPGETYHYVSKEEFERAIADGEMLEYAKYGENYYGTPRSSVEKDLNEGRDVLLEIEPQGAMQVKSRLPEAVLVFLVPPSMHELKRRLVTRGREGAEEIEKRIATARWELTQAEKYSVHILNDSLDECVDDVIAYFEEKRAERRKIEELINEQV